jgi:hypothetical protein
VLEIQIASPNPESSFAERSCSGSSSSPIQVASCQSSGSSGAPNIATSLHADVTPARSQILTRQCAR